MQECDKGELRGGDSRVAKLVLSEVSEPSWALCGHSVYHMVFLPFTRELDSRSDLSFFLELGFLVWWERVNLFSKSHNKESGVVYAYQEVRF